MNCPLCNTLLAANSNVCPNNACGHTIVSLPGQLITLAPPPPLRYGPLTQPTPQPNNPQPQPQPQPQVQPLVVQQQPASRGVHGLTIASFVIACVCLAFLMGFWFHWSQRGTSTQDLKDGIVAIGTNEEAKLTTAVDKVKANTDTKVDAALTTAVDKVKTNTDTKVDGAVTNIDNKIGNAATGINANITADGSLTRAAVQLSEMNLKSAITADGVLTRAAVADAKARLAAAMRAAVRANAENNNAAKAELLAATADLKKAVAAQVVVDNKTEDDSDSATDGETDH